MIDPSSTPLELEAVAAVSAALSAGKFAKSSAPRWLASYMSDPDATAALLAELWCPPDGQQLFAGRSPAESADASTTAGELLSAMWPNLFGERQAADAAPLDEADALLAQVYPPRAA